MGKETGITWTHHTFNPWWGCEKVSPGCAHCYAETWAKRCGHAVWGGKAPRRFFGEKHWNQPLAWNAAAMKAGERRRVFCASMADWLEDREDLTPWLANLLRIIAATPDLDWLLLTKRPESFQSRINRAYSAAGMGSGAVEPDWIWHWANGHGCVPPNVWIGTTVEDQQRAEERIPHLLKIPAKVRFLSCEPMLGPVDLQRMALLPGIGYGLANPLQGAMPHVNGGRRGPSLDWVICGGESGGPRRPFQVEWAEELQQQCIRAGVAFFMKQDGHLKDGQQGRIPDELWQIKEFPTP